MGGSTIASFPCWQVAGLQGKENSDSPKGVWGGNETRMYPCMVIFRGLHL